MFSGVILDMDGTLVDSNDAHARAWVEALVQHGHVVSFEEVRRLIGMGGDNLLPRVIGQEKDSPAGKEISKTRKAIFQTRYLPGLKPFPEARALLRRMRDAGLKLVVASSAEQEELDALLNIAGVTDLVEATTSSSEARHSKPAPDPVQVALRKLGQPADRAVMLGDTPYDIESARKAGVRTISVRCGGWGDADLSGAIAVYDDPADLLAHYPDSPLGAENRKSL